MPLNCPTSVYHRAYKSHVPRQAAIIGNPISHSQYSPCQLKDQTRLRPRKPSTHLSPRLSFPEFIYPPPAIAGCLFFRLLAPAHQSAWKSNNLFLGSGKARVRKCRQCRCRRRWWCHYTNFQTWSHRHITLPCYAWCLVCWHCCC